MADAEFGDWWLPAPGARPLTLVAASVAIYGCVPETDQMTMIWIITVGTTLAEVVLRRRCPPGLLTMLAGIVLWSGLYGATGRGSAIVGALFAFWPVVIVAVVAVLRPRLRSAGSILQLVVSGIGAVGAVAVARTGAIEPDLGPALVAVAIAVPVTLGAAATVATVAMRHRRF